MSELSEKAYELHVKMLETNSSSHFYSQEEIEQLICQPDKKFVVLWVQELIDFHLIKVGSQNGSTVFAAIQKAEAEKVSKMTKEENMIYRYIEAAGREGVWQKIIKAKSNLHQHVFVKSLKNLELKRYVKSIKDVKHPTRKIYMLYNLQPSIELTGGPWFTDSELDTEFVESLLNIVWRFVAQKSFPRPQENPNPEQCSYDNEYQGYATLQDILDFIKKNQISTVDLSINDIRSLCNVLMFEDKINRLPMLDAYKATWQSMLESGIETGEEPVIKETSYSIFDFYTQVPHGDEDTNIVYLDNWINA